MQKKIEEILKALKAHELTEESASDALLSYCETWFRESKALEGFYEDIGYAKVDHLREKNKGFAEVVYCASKTPEQVAGIVSALHGRGTKNILLTRADGAVLDAVRALDPEAAYNQAARTVVCFAEEQEPKGGTILVACAGTSDLPVAEEAAVTAEVMGNRVERLYDVGVAGIHRLLMNTDKLKEASVIVAVAGMEGALPSVIGGLTDKPVIAVPTSVGYGTNFGGVSALLTMLNSCSSGISVVNIDNGFGAGYQAALINNLTKR
jgi:NCAIR mutase (PurE)-related protein